MAVAVETLQKDVDKGGSWIAGTMYNCFFGLTKDPFTLTADPDVIYLTTQHREALAGLSYAILARKGFIVLTGDAGTGKSTLIRRVLQRLPRDRVQTSVILNPTLTIAEFLEMTLLDFGISEIPASKPRRLQKLQNFLLAGQSAGKVSALIIDEAHKLSPELLEEIRLLSNFEYADQKLLQIVMAGQTELDHMLCRADLRQLKQRIAVRLNIQPLPAGDVDRYIRLRWTQAGGAIESPFQPEAVHAIVRWSQGIPRLINSICDTALMVAFAEESKTVTAPFVAEACKDLNILEMPPVDLSVAINGPAKPAEAAAAPVPGSNTGMPVGILERYYPAPKPSLLRRWARRIGLVEAI
jgi:general secretion pathway protein A